MMLTCLQTLTLLCLAAAVPLGKVEEEALQRVKNMTQIPPAGNSSVSRLLIQDQLISLNEGDRSALASYPALTELHLDHNVVITIPAGYFSVVPHLRVLSLSYNLISRLDPEALSGLKDLTELDLSHNQLTSLPEKLFSGINSLQVLRLQGNPWNCSCPLLLSIQQLTAAKVNFGEPRVTCESPEHDDDLLEATAKCYPSPSQPPSTTVGSRQETTLSSDHNQSTTNNQTLVLGNTWKFTTSVLALALTTATLILCAIKGPSWYKLLHNYRHRRLTDDMEDEDDDDDTRMTGVPGSGRQFTFKEDIWQINSEEEEEEGEEYEEYEEEEYFEDPYIRRDE